MRAILSSCLALLLAAGCATPPPPATLGPPMAYPPSVRERLLRIAAEEWREWGAIAVPDAANPGEVPPRLEGLADNMPRLIAYWRSVPDDEGAIARARAEYAPDPLAPPATLWADPPWSAAFISYLMLRAGVDVREFPPDASHALYLDGLTATAAAWPATAPFVPLAPEQAVPAPGDLVCADRSRAPLPAWSARAAEVGRFRPMHCDLVLQTAPGSVSALGGNVADAVVLTRFATDTSGRLLPRGPGRAPWVVVMQNRLGQLPPFGVPGS
ncbi:DUF2272 domain-containing protein [Humitalea sp. 24SJ18S-53]|uniref:DUF2272 domain-containing protein n=1 Tax=Humitalea sp. 24SJ18S-53 TaxID=3422307 RepID=UPI003D67FA69